jgi:hypothetical protein
MNFSAEFVADTFPETPRAYPAMGNDPNVSVVSNFYTKKCYSCRLCVSLNTESESKAYKHTQDSEHVAKKRKLDEDHGRIREIIQRSCRVLAEPNHSEIVARAESIQSKLWKNTVQAEVYRYVFAQDDPQHLLLEAPRKTLKRYESLEPFVMLDLAVWKAECLRQMPNVGTDFYAAQQWVTGGGWKACKTEMRKSNAMSIVVALVRPFLDSRRM